MKDKKKTVQDITKDMDDIFFYKSLASLNMLSHKEVAELLKQKKNYETN